MGVSNECGRPLPRNTSVLSFVVFGMAIVVINCAQGSDAGVILWCSGAMVFVATTAQAAWMPRKAHMRRDRDLWVIIGLAKLLVAGGVVAIALMWFSRSDSVALAIMALAATVLTGLGAGLSSRPTLVLAVCLAANTTIGAVLSLWMPLTIGLYLLGAVFAGLTAVAVMLVSLPRDRWVAFQPAPAELAHAAVVRWADVLLLPLFLSERQALIYLTVRCAVAVVTAVVEAVQRVILPRLIEAHRTATRLVFRGLVARASLGVMLIGGAVGMVAMMVGPIIFPHQVIGGEGLRAFHVLLLVALVPVLLGICPAMLSILVAPRRMAAAYGANLGIMAVVIAAFGPTTAIVMAQAVATGHGIGALVLAWTSFRQLGLLPPITAVLHPKIRLRDASAR